MGKFIKNFGLFLLLALILSGCLILLYVLYYQISFRDIPAENLSDSYSYNEKMRFLRKNNKGAEIMTIGSSMSLNNLSPEKIKTSLHSTSYINTASWGMSLKDNYLLLKIMYEITPPKTIIFCSNIIDFQQSEKKVKYPILKKYLSSNFIGYTLLKTFNLKYYLTNFRYAKKVRSCKNEYEYLNFDQTGSINYDTSNFIINKERWNGHFLNNKIVPIQYSYLDSISIFCREKNIKLIVFQSPIRYNLYNSLNKKEIKNLTTHISNIRFILKKNNHIFVNSSDEKWEDNLFVDGIHFNKYGAEKFTEYCFKQLNRTNE